MAACAEGQDVDQQLLRDIGFADSYMQGLRDGTRARRDGLHSAEFYVKLSTRCCRCPPMCSAGAAPAFAERRKAEEKQMKSRFFHCSAVASLLAAMAFTPTAALSKYVCDNPSSMIDKRACAKAAEGASALRNFVERTRMIWQLDIWDYARPEQPSASTSAAAKPALREAEVLSKLAAITTD